MKLVYIHGYGSDSQSRKYQDLKKAFSNFEPACIEWNEETNFEKLFYDAHQHYKDEETIILIGDSTGANFAFQLRELRTYSGLQTILILTSPLLNIANRLLDITFSDNLASNLCVITKVENAFVLIARNDDVLSFADFNITDSTNSIVMYVEDNHRLLDFATQIPYIETYIFSKLA